MTTTSIIEPSVMLKRSHTRWPEVVVIEAEVMVAISMLIVVLSVTMALVRSSGDAVSGMSGNGDDVPADTSSGGGWW